MAVIGTAQACLLLNILNLVGGLVCPRGTNRLCACDTHRMSCNDEVVKRLPVPLRKMLNLKELDLKLCDISFILDTDLDNFPRLVTLDVRSQISSECVELIGRWDNRVTVLGGCEGDRHNDSTTEREMIITETTDQSITTDTTMTGITTTPTLKRSTPRLFTTRKIPRAGPSVINMTTRGPEDLTTASDVLDDSTAGRDIETLVIIYVGSVLSGVTSLATLLSLMVKVHFYCLKKDCKCIFCKLRKKRKAKSSPKVNRRGKRVVRTRAKGVYSKSRCMHP